MMDIMSLFVALAAEHKQRTRHDIFTQRPLDTLKTSCDVCLHLSAFNCERQEKQAKQKKLQNMRDKKKAPTEWLQAPLTPPMSLINNLSLRCFNECYFRLHSRQQGLQRCHYSSFFFPLDGVKHWNRIYGRNGFLQYQFVLCEVE